MNNIYIFIIVWIYWLIWFVKWSLNFNNIITQDTEW